MTEPKILTETDEFFVINKPAGFSVEPHPRFPSIADWIQTLYTFKGIRGLNEKDGVVHRLDVETSGVMIWAKNIEAQEKLKLLWQGRQTEKTYLALVVGETEVTGEIDLAIKRDNKNNKQKVVMLNDGSGRPAITRFKRLAVGEISGQKVSLVEAHPVTGRTHQIRVHFKAIGHPLIGDRLYGEKASNEVAQSLGLGRHFLHATELCLPINEQRTCYQAPLPTELTAALDKIGITR